MKMLKKMNEVKALMDTVSKRNDPKHMMSLNGREEYNLKSALSLSRCFLRA